MTFMHFYPELRRKPLHIFTAAVSKFQFQRYSDELQKVIK